MQIALVVDKGPFDLSLQRCSLIIAIYYLITTLLGSILIPSYYTRAETMVGFMIVLIGNLCLLFGALRNNRWLVLVWLIQALLTLINWPIAFLGVIFNYGNYRQLSVFHNVILIILEYIVVLIIFLYVCRLVYSFYQQLRGAQANPQHAVVV